MTESKDSSLKPLAVRDFTGPQDFVKAANEEHYRRLSKTPPSLPGTRPWVYRYEDNSGLQRIQFFGVTAWRSLDDLNRLAVTEILTVADRIARNASVWASDRTGDACDGLVAGRRTVEPIAAMVRRAAALIRDEQAKPSPDNALVSCLCEAVRMAREYADFATRPIA